MSMPGRWQTLARRSARSIGPITGLDRPTCVVLVGVLPKTYAGQSDCTIARALEIVGERWTLLILRDAFFGVRRFNDFHAHLAAPRTVLSTRLQGLVDTGLLERRPDPHHAGRTPYELTPARPAPWPAIYALRASGPRAPRGADRPPGVFPH